MDIGKIYQQLSLDEKSISGGELGVFSPIDGAYIARVAIDDETSLKGKIAASQDAFFKWRTVPAPRRGELIRLFGQELRAHKETLGQLVTLESGKIFQEGLGEVQEMIDICDFAVGLSRQLYGLTIASERPSHRMMETWHPLGPVGVISAFNFPVAVWAWNAAIAIVCGNPVVWKPSEKTPVCALACQRLFERAVAIFGDAPEALSQILIGDRVIGEQLVDDPRVALVSATGSCQMGQSVGPRVAARFGRALLELGGNNALILAPSADLELAVRAIIFSAVGTAGQRCTSLRRLIIHQSIQDEISTRLKSAYDSIAIGNPMDDGSLVGPLIDQAAFLAMENALGRAKSEGGKIFGGGRVLEDQFPDAFYVRPAYVEMPRQTETVREETFAPILFAMPYDKFDQALEIQNDVSQGLASSIFTNDLVEAEKFLSVVGSDCGIANVNIGPSGAEIGGAFGGEKQTGGGRESGSDSWKNYMRRATNTINYSPDLPLAQGIRFETH